MDMLKKVYAMSPESGARGRIESSSLEQARQEGFFNELSTRTQHQRNEIDGMTRIITALRDRVNHLERHLKEALMRQGSSVQGLQALR